MPDPQHLVLTPLDKTPLDHKPLERRIEHLLNPKFINEVVYDELLMNPQTRQMCRGFIARADMRERLHDRADEREANLVIEVLTQYNVIFEYKRLGQRAGYVIPDQFDRRMKGQFEPEEDATVMRVWKADGFVAEHALFELMAAFKDKLEPIDNQVIAFRDACRFKEQEADVQVYLNVLTRKLTIYGRGERANALIDRLIGKITDESECVWELTDEWRGLTKKEQRYWRAFETMIKEDASSQITMKSELREKLVEKYRLAYCWILKRQIESKAPRTKLEIDRQVDKINDRIGRAGTRDRSKCSSYTDARVNQLRRMQPPLLARVNEFSLTREGKAVAAMYEEDGTFLHKLRPEMTE